MTKNVLNEIEKRMIALGIENTFDSFKEEGKVYMSDSYGIVDVNIFKEVKKAIKDTEKQYDLTVYHIVHTTTRFGEMYAMFYVSNSSEEDWEMDMEDIKDGYVFSYVWNKTSPAFSEFGTIAIKKEGDKIVRIG